MCVNSISGSEKEVQVYLDKVRRTSRGKVQRNFVRTLEELLGVCGSVVHMLCDAKM